MKFQNQIPIAQLERRIARALFPRADRRTSAGAEIPVYEGPPVVGHLVDALRDPIGMCMNAMRCHGDVVRIPIALHEILLFNHPQAYEHVLVRNYADYRRGFSHKILRAVVGLGMLTAENAEWVETRRAAAPRLSAKAVAAMGPTIDAHLERWLPRWDAAAERGETRALALDFMDLTSQIAWDLLFGYAMSDAEARRFTEDFIGLQDDIFMRLRLPILPPRPASFARLRRIEALAAKLRRSPAAGSLADQTMTILATAPENPSNTLGWACYLLAKHPEHAARIRAEQSTGDSEQLTQVLHETMRLYPGGWLYERIAERDDVVAGYQVGAGSCLVFCPYTMHRNPEYWAQPERFLPERFADGVRGLPAYTYVPFSAGPRRCVGDRYTVRLVTQILARFVGRYRVVLDERERGEPWPMFTLRSKTGMLARLERV
jgi:enediyne biosynthesis protein E7